MSTTSASVYCALEEFRYIYFVVIVFVLDTMFMTLNLASEVVFIGEQKQGMTV